MATESDLLKSLMEATASLEEHADALRAHMRQLLPDGIDADSLRQALVVHAAGLRRGTEQRARTLKTMLESLPLMASLAGGAASRPDCAAWADARRRDAQQYFDRAGPLAVADEADGTVQTARATKQGLAVKSATELVALLDRAAARYSNVFFRHGDDLGGLKRFGHAASTTAIAGMRAMVQTDVTGLARVRNSLVPAVHHICRTHSTWYRTVTDHHRREMFLRDDEEGGVYLRGLEACEKRQYCSLQLCVAGVKLLHSPAAYLEPFHTALVDSARRLDDAQVRLDTAAAAAGEKPPSAGADVAARRADLVAAQRSLLERAKILAAMSQSELKKVGEELNREAVATRAVVARDYAEESAETIKAANSSVDAVTGMIHAALTRRVRASEESHEFYRSLCSDLPESDATNGAAPHGKRWGVRGRREQKGSGSAVLGAELSEYAKEEAEQAAEAAAAMLLAEAGGEGSVSASAGVASAAAGAGAKKKKKKKKKALPQPAEEDPEEALAAQQRQRQQEQREAAELARAAAREEQAAERKRLEDAWHAEQARKLELFGPAMAGNVDSDEEKEPSPPPPQASPQGAPAGNDPGDASEAPPHPPASSGVVDTTNSSASVAEGEGVGGSAGGSAAGMTRADDGGASGMPSTEAGASAASRSTGDKVAAVIAKSEKAKGAAAATPVDDALGGFFKAKKKGKKKKGKLSGFNAAAKMAEGAAGKEGKAGDGAQPPAGASTAVAGSGASSSAADASKSAAAPSSSWAGVLQKQKVSCCCQEQKCGHLVADGQAICAFDFACPPAGPRFELSDHMSCICYFYVLLV